MKTAMATLTVSPPPRGARGGRRSRNAMVVERLFDAILDCDRERVLSFFSEESRLDAGALPAATGPDAIWQALAEGLARAERIEWQIREIQETEPGVVRARHGGRFRAGGRWQQFQRDDHFLVRGCKILGWLAAPGDRH